ncbi:hypothetical protein K2Y11_08110 [bacterium]|nr:hypothetical protein [bacterium]
MAVRTADRVRELYYSYAQATRNWLTASDRSRPDGLIELGVLLGESLSNSVRSQAGELGTRVREEFYRTWTQSTAKLLHALEPFSPADRPSSSLIPSSQQHLRELFDQLHAQFVSLDGPHVLRPHDQAPKTNLKRQLISVEEAEFP